MLCGLGVAAVCCTFAACNGVDGGGDSGSIFSRPVVEKVAGKKKAWNDVSSFTDYYGPLSGDAEADPVNGGDSVPILDRLKEFDVAIIHSASMFSAPNGKEIVKQLQDSGTYVIAYISIGEEIGPKIADGLGEKASRPIIYMKTARPNKTAAGVRIL